MRTIQLSFLFLIISSSLQAAYIKGLIIRKSDTLNVTLMISDEFEPSYEKLQYGIKYKDANGTKLTILPNQANEIRFMHSGKEIRMLSRIYNESYKIDTTRRLFLKLEKEGRINLFSFYSKSTYSTPGGPNGVPMTYSNVTLKHLLQKGTMPLVMFESMNFKTEFPNYIRECPSLVKMLENKLYSKYEIDRIINYYNSNCGL